MKRGRAGFTLVELLVVIVILGILAGVGTVAYSGYITRANEEADRTLIRDVERALLAGGYGDLSSGGGIVTISKDGADGTTDSVKEMMRKAFGDDWQSTVRFKSKKYSEGATALFKVLTGLKNENKDYVAAMKDSSFYKDGDTKELMTQVDDLVDALTTALGNRTGDMASALRVFWGPEFNSLVTEQGLDGDYAVGAENNTRVAANLTVMAAAHQISGASEEKKEEWISTWGSLGKNNGTGVADVVMNFARYNALVSYIDDPDLDAEYNNMIIDFGKFTDDGYVQKFNARLAQFDNAINEYCPDKVAAYQAKPAEGGLSQAEKDAQSFIATMSGLKGMEDEVVTKDYVAQLRQAGTFQNSAAPEVLSAAVAMSAADLANFPAGGYAIMLEIRDHVRPVVTPTLDSGS